MRKCLILVLVAALTVAACEDDDDTAPASSADDKTTDPCTRLGEAEFEPQLFFLAVYPPGAVMELDERELQLLREQMRDQLGVLAEMGEVAPDEIADDIALLEQFFEPLYDVVQEWSVPIDEADLADVLDVLEEAEQVDAALRNIDDYFEDHCETAPSSTSEAPATYPEPKGERHVLSMSTRGKMEMGVGDVLVFVDPEEAIVSSRNSDVLVLVEVTSEERIYQAVAPGVTGIEFQGSHGGRIVEVVVS